MEAVVCSEGSLPRMWGSVTPDMEIAITSAHWTKEIGAMTPPELAQWMLSIAKHAKLADYETYRWSPKKEQPKRASGNRDNHLATAEIIDKRKKTPRPNIFKKLGSRRAAGIFQPH